MRTVLTMISRELKSYFFSIIGYVIWTIFLLIYGYVFWVLLNAFSNPQNSFNEPLSQFFFGTFYYWFVLVIIPPLLTMRSIAEERKTGVFETLMTSPVAEWQVIISKFIAALLFFCLMWLSTIIYFYLIAPHTDLDWYRVFNGYLGTCFVGGVFISLGIFSSSFSKNQIIAAITSFGLGLLIFSLGFIAYFINIPSIKSFLDYINIMENTMKFSEGLLDTRPIIFFLSLTIFFLFSATKILDSRRWR